MLRSSGWILAFVLAAPALAVTETSVVIPPARRQVVSARADLVKLCGSEAWIYGCTKFLGQKLTGDCSATGVLWQMRPSAQFIPFMYLWQPRWIGHENLHIEDIRGDVHEYLEELESKRFASSDDCRRVAETEEASFPSRMDEWKKASNAKRHSGR